MTMTLVSTVTVGAEGASGILFSAIPQTATDIFIAFSYFCDVNDSNMSIRFNGDSAANYTVRRLIGTGASVSSTTSTAATSIDSQSTNPSTYGANNRSSGSIYIPNYTASTAKSLSLDSVLENNATDSRQNLIAARWSGTAAITSVDLYNPNGIQFSTASLYTITKGSGGATVS